MWLSIFAGIFLNRMIAVLSSGLDLDRTLSNKEPVLYHLSDRRSGIKPFCSKVTENPFANCAKMRFSGKCGLTSVMNTWCPKTCKFCIEDRASAHLPCELTKYGCCADGIRAAKGKNRLGCPELCQDNPKYNGLCEYYAKQGYCEIYHKTLKAVCPRSCKMCDKKIIDGCYNKLDDSTCKRYGEYGFCRSPALKKRMAKLCALTCQICTDNAPKLLDVTPSCAERGCCWDNRTPLSQRCPPCRDIFQLTICPSFKSYCSLIDRIPGVQMRMMCPATCGICQNKFRCQDDITYGIYCKQWKDEGECKRNKPAMKLFCKRTCAFC